MLDIQNLSFWEKNTYFENNDFVVIGAGIVGCSTALHLKKKYPKAKILVLERGYLPLGASTKNAGFACFGSVSELIDDLNHRSADEVWSIVQKRWAGLNYLKELLGEQALGYEGLGSWDLMDQASPTDLYDDQLSHLNQVISEITGKKNVYKKEYDLQNRFGFQGIHMAYGNRLEGQVSTGKMMQSFHRLLVENEINLLHGIEVKNLSENTQGTELECNIGTFSADQVVICVNGFAQQFLPELDVRPTRAQVLITKPIKDLAFSGTFHYQKGYYYFRNVGDRVLFGGGRNLDFAGEQTDQFQTTEFILADLKKKLKDIILPDTAHEVAYAWAGIMGTGASKEPIVKRISSKLTIGVRMGGMGVAIGSLIGKETADLL